MNEETIAAISTPFAQGGIGIIRISGSLAKNVASKVFKSINSKSIHTLDGYQALFGRVFDKDGDIDEAILLNFNAPYSYTGEDVIELSVHSGLYILKRVLRAVIESGARLAQCGEFTKRAFLNGKISLTEAEAVMDLISAHNSQAANAALLVKDGAIHNQISNKIDELVELVGKITAWIDYPEEDLISINRSEIIFGISKIRDNLSTLESNFDTGKIIKEGISVVIAGKPNVGKSTIMNLISGYEKSITTQIPGTTRDIIEENVLLDDIMINLFDTAGLRETADIVEQHGVSLAYKKLNQADIVLLVFDNSARFNIEDENLINIIKGIPTIAIINKFDLKSNLELSKIKNLYNNVITISATDIKSKEIISNEIKNILNLKYLKMNTMFLSNERQLYLVKDAIYHLDDAINSLKTGLTYDAIVVCIETAIEFLSQLTGKNVTDMVINEIFSNFCVGK